MSSGHLHSSEIKVAQSVALNYLKLLLMYKSVWPTLNRRNGAVSLFTAKFVIGSGVLILFRVKIRFFPIDKNEWPLKQH